MGGVLRDADLFRLLEATEILHDHPAAAFGARLGTSARHLFGEGFVSFDVFGADGSHFVENDIPFDARLAVVARERGARLIQADHPGMPRVMRGERTPLRLSDVTNERTFRETALHRELYRPVDVRVQLLVPVVPPAAVGGLTINRDRVDFSERDLALAALFGRHLERAFATHRLLALRAGAIEETEAQFSARLARLGLTPRQSAVLYWLGQGKQNAEIAIILGITARTVEVHLATVYRKLRVENRTAALAALARLAG